MNILRYTYCLILLLVLPLASAKGDGEQSFYGIPLDEQSLDVSVSPIKEVWATNEPVVVQITLKNVSREIIEFHDSYPISLCGVSFDMPGNIRREKLDELPLFSFMSRVVRLKAGESHQLYFPLNDLAKFIPGTHQWSYTLFLDGRTGEDKERVIFRSAGNFVIEVAEHALSPDELAGTIELCRANEAISRRALGEIMLWFDHPDAAEALVEMAQKRQMPAVAVLKAIRRYSNQQWVSTEVVAELSCSWSTEELKEGLQTLWHRRDAVPRSVVEWASASSNTTLLHILTDHYLEYGIRDHLDLLPSDVIEGDEHDLAKKIRSLLSTPDVERKESEVGN